MISNFSFPHSTPFNLSGSGKVIATDDPLQVTGISGTPVIWSGTSAPALIPNPPALSPDGSFFSVQTDSLAVDPPMTCDIYQNGTLVTAVPGYAAGWIDNGHIFVQNWKYTDKGAVFTGIGVYSPDGKELISYPADAIPAINNPQFLPGNLVFDLGFDQAGRYGGTGSIYSLTDGSLVWQAPSAARTSNGVAAVSGSDVVFQVGHQVLLYPY